MSLTSKVVLGCSVMFSGGMIYYVHHQQVEEKEVGVNSYIITQGKVTLEKLDI